MDRSLWNIHNEFCYSLMHISYHHRHIPWHIWNNHHNSLIDTVLVLLVVHMVRDTLELHHYHTSPHMGLDHLDQTRFRIPNEHKPFFRLIHFHFGHRNEVWDGNADFCKFLHRHHWLDHHHSLVVSKNFQNIPYYEAAMAIEIELSIFLQCSLLGGQLWRYRPLSSVEEIQLPRDYYMRNHWKFINLELRVVAFIFFK